MTKYNGIKGRLYPNHAQLQQIKTTCNHSRFVWNTFLGMLNERRQNNKSLKILSHYDMSCLLTQLKREHPWLKEADSIALQETIKRLSLTFERFFKGVSRYPRFKSKHRHQDTFTSSICKSKGGNNIQFNGNETYIKIPKLGWVKCKMSRKYIDNSKIKSVTVKPTASGRIAVSVLVESESQTFNQTHNQVGIDFGVSDLVITSDGHVHPSQRLHLKYKKQMIVWERRMARRRIQAEKRGVPLSEAKNYQKAKRQVARIHEKIKHSRQDYVHKITTKLVQDYDLIAIEDLKTKNLMKNRNLAKAIAAQSWRQFRDILSYKCLDHGKVLKIVNPYKTSQVCSHCQYDDGKKALHIRKWICPSCHSEHDRDINAANNILRLGLGQTLVK